MHKFECSASVNQLIIEALLASKDGVGVFNQDDLLIFCNEPLAKDFGFTVDEVIGKSFEEMMRLSYLSGAGVHVENDDLEGLIERAKQSRLKLGYTSFESDRANGDWTLVSRLRTEDGHIFLYTQDITELKKTEASLRETLNHVKNLAATDSLTGISNRRHFMESSVIEFDRSKRHGHPLTILALDIDHFKSINDTFGHQAGDEVLRSICTCCQSLLRASDIFGRLGGEEFSILLPDTDKESASIMAQRILDNISALKVKYEEGIISFTTSIGISQLTDECQNMEALMKNSDEALYKAKNNGRNRMEIY